MPTENQAPSLYIVNNHAVRLLAQLLTLASDAKRPINPEFVVQSLTCDLARTDPTGAVNLEETLDRFGAVMSTLAAEIGERVYDMNDARHDLQDWRHERYKLSLPSRGAGHGDIGAVPLPDSLAALPPPVRAHVLARYGRELRGSDARALDRMRADGDGELAEAMQAEINDRGVIAAENGSAAGLPLAVLGNGEYATEIGGE